MLTSALHPFKHTIQDRITPEIMELVYAERWLQIWVPKQYKGLGVSFREGLEILKQLAAFDGSLGWMVTLCAGANYFARNLQPTVALDLFQHHRTCFGGSGMIGGTATKTASGYLINGEWKYATGAPHLSHFTLNATITEHGKTILNADGTPVVRSFVLDKNDVTIIPDWQSMGMKATGTYSFEVKDVLVSPDYSFEYNIFYTDNILDKIPFRIFADLTLLVNYIGMAEHFFTVANTLKPNAAYTTIHEQIERIQQDTLAYADAVESLLIQNDDTEIIRGAIHQFGIDTVQHLSHEILKAYMHIGIIASHDNQPINTIFKDFFTATQHANFRI